MKFLRCPCCNKLHFTRLNGLLYENPYLTLREFKLKKRIKCGKCHSDIAIFFNEETLKIRVIWEEYHKVYDDAFKKQKELQFEKEEVLKIENNEEKQKPSDMRAVSHTATSTVCKSRADKLQQEPNSKNKDCWYFYNLRKKTERN